MPRTITIDSVQVVQLQLVKDQKGEIQVYAEYHLKEGNKIIQGSRGLITEKIGASRKAAALAVFNEIANDLAGAELA